MGLRRGAGVQYLGRHSELFLWPDYGRIGVPSVCAGGVSPCRIVEEQDDILVSSIVRPWWVSIILPEVKIMYSSDLAHLHHAWEVYTNGGKTVNAAKRALLITCELVDDGLLEIRLTSEFAYVQ